MDEIQHLEQAIAHLESQRATLGDAIVEASIAAIQKELDDLQSKLKPVESGERKLVTIMFADMSGFTALSEKMDPEAVRDLMNSCFDRLVPCINRYDGMVDKFIGDEIMALFGAPIAHENDPERALRAALEMEMALAQFNAEQKTQLGIHFGINTGLVLAGGIGSSGKQDYSVMGDAVNLAARLEDISERGQVLAGPDTYRMTAALFEFEALPPVSVKGKTEPVAVYRLVSAKAGAVSARGLARQGLFSPLVGREKEFQILQNAIEAARSGQGGMVGVIGEAGLGKSRLMAELHHCAVDIQWLEGKTLSYGQSISYWPFQEIVRSYAGITEDNVEIEAWNKLASKIVALFPDTAQDILPYLAILLAVEVQGEYIELVKYLDGDSLGKRLYMGMWRFLERLARRQPLVLVFEDLHWMDASSVELLEHILTLVHEVPLLVIGVSRPDPNSAGAHLQLVCAEKYAGLYSEIHLAPLSQGESSQLVNNLLAVDDLPERVRAAMTQKADGNPFFIEEIIRSLLDMGAIVHDPSTGRWRATAQIEAVHIPDTVQGVIMARIDRLDEGVKQALRVAAVIGRNFLYRILREVDPTDVALDEHLAHLQQMELIRKKDLAPDLEYIFKHALAQEATYESILIQKRRELHGRVATAIETLFSERLDEFYSLLAYHYAKAENWTKAQEYLFKAGDQAGNMAADFEALAHYQQAIEAYSKVFGEKWNPIQRAQVERKLGEALFRRGQNEQAILHLQRALFNLGRPLPTSPLRKYIEIASEILKQASHRIFPTLLIKSFQKDIDPALQEMCLIVDTMTYLSVYTEPTASFLPVLRRLNESERKGYAYGMLISSILGIFLAYLSSYKLAKIFLNQGMASAEWLQDPLALAVAWDGLRDYSVNRGEHDQAIASANKAADLFRRAGRLFEWGQVHNAIGVSLSYQGKMIEAIPYLEEEIQVAKEAGIENLYTMALSTIGFCYLNLKQFEKAIPALQEGLDVAKVNAYTFNIVSCGGTLLLCFVQTGQYEKARAMLEEIYPCYQKNPNMWGAQIPLLWGRAEYYLIVAQDAAKNERRRLLKLARQACDEAIKSSYRFRPGLPESMRIRGRYEWLCKKQKAAVKWWQQALKRAKEQGQRYDEAMIQLEMGQLLNDRTHLEQAVAILGKIGDEPDLERAKELLAKINRGN